MFEGRARPEGGGSMGPVWAAEAVAVEARRRWWRVKRHVLQRWVLGPG